jgi:hypothetical protein
MATIEQIRDVLAPIYSDIFGRDAAGRLNIDVAPDHDGEEALYLRARIEPQDSDKLYGTAHSEFAHRMFDALRAINELRFPYVRFDLGDLDPTVESDLVKRMVRSQ